MPKDIERVSDILSHLLTKWGLKKGIEQHKALVVWGQVVGKGISAHTRPIWVNNGILLVVVDDSIWQQELEFIKSQIVERINQHLRVKIREIKFIQKRYGS